MKKVVRHKYTFFSIRLQIPSHTFYNVPMKLDNRLPKHNEPDTVKARKERQESGNGQKEIHGRI